MMADFHVATIPYKTPGKPPFPVDARQLRATWTRHGAALTGSHPATSPNTRVSSKARAKLETLKPYPIFIT
jgi:hypothetical protein